METITVKAFCGNTFTYEGNTCVVIVPPTNVSPLTKVPVYDLDAGLIFKLTLFEIVEAPKGRSSEPQDFQFSKILASKYANDAQGIVDVLFDD
jgi:hypothetical protein